MSEQSKSIGALWIKHSKTGSQFYSGVIKIDGKDTRVVIFENNRKTKPTSPDFNIFESKPRDTQIPLPRVVHESDDIPF